MDRSLPMESMDSKFNTGNPSAFRTKCKYFQDFWEMATFITTPYSGLLFLSSILFRPTLLFPGSLMALIISGYWVVIILGYW